MKKLLILLFLIPSLTYSQPEYVAEAPLTEVKASGFYSIPISADIHSLSFPDTRNIRILDGQGAEVPYVMVLDPPDYTSVKWVDMDIEVELRKGCCTIVTLHNEEKISLDNFLLQVRNARVNKIGNLQGSDDKQTWYAVNEKIPLTLSKLNTDVVTEVFDFPLSNYSYYKLTINDSSSSPINVVGALRTQADIIHGSYIEIPDLNFVSHDSVQTRTTWATIEFETEQYVDRLEFDVEGPHLFKRRATLFVNEEYFVRGVSKTRLRELNSFEMISGQARPVFVGSKQKKFFLRIDNENNPPLKVTQVAAYQLKLSLVAYLETGRDYRVMLGDNLEKPRYDLEFFKDSIPARPAELKIGKLKELSVLKQPASKTFFTDPKFIWVAIILVGIVLVGMTVRMLREKDMGGK